MVTGVRRPAVEQVVRGQHQQTGLSLCLCGQRNVNCHLVAVEVGVECGTIQRMRRIARPSTSTGSNALNAQTAGSVHGSA